jgi:putative SOS response-associated peptidase YedK
VVDGKQVSEPHYFTLDEPFVFAAVYDVNTIASDKPIYSFSIVTTEPNEVVRPVHPRAPRILSPEDALRWLDSDLEVHELRTCLK